MSFLTWRGLNFVTSEDAGYIADRFKNILQEQEVKAVRYQIISKDGRTHWFETSGRLIKTPHQRRKYQLVAVTRNIDKTVDFENELQKANKKIHESLIEAQSANIAKSQFLATMSHELRTPLNAVIGFSEMISHEGHGEVQPKYKEYAGYIHDSGNKLLHIICDILELSKIHTGKIDLDKKPIDLSHIIRDCCDIMKGCVKDAELCLDNHVTDHCPKMIADAQAIKQMLTNILSNAVKYTSPGGKNDISYHMGKHELKLFIEDTGIGICRQDLEKVLEPFTQVEQTRLHHQSGIGLGLPLAKALIELHDGSLLLESKVNQGTKVTLCFPRKIII